MALRIVCTCGYVIQGDNDDELWANAQDHMGVLHPELVGNVTREDILAQAEMLGSVSRSAVDADGVQAAAGKAEGSADTGVVSVDPRQRGRSSSGRRPAPPVG